MQECIFLAANVAYRLHRTIIQSNCGIFLMNFMAHIPDPKNDLGLYKCKDMHRGRRCFIVGNGPSLRIEDLDRLQGELTFASNRIFLAFEQTEWRPSYYTMCDAVVGQENRAIVRALPLKKIFAGSVRPYFSKDPNALFVNMPRLRDEQGAVVDAYGILRMQENELWPSLRRRALFLMERLGMDAALWTLRWDTSWPVSWNLIRGARAGHSVINLGLKAAYWMGIREVYVIGCDHHFSVPDTRTGERVYQNEVILSQGEQNHFHPEYRKSGEKWTLPRLDIIAEEFAYARRVFEADGGFIKNASRMTQLEVWDRVDFDALALLPQQKSPDIGSAHP